MAWPWEALRSAVAGGAGVLPLSAPRTDVTLLETQVSWVVPVLGLALVAAVVAYVTGIAGARLLGAKVASFVGLTEVLFAVVFAWVLLGQSLGSVQLHRRGAGGRRHRAGACRRACAHRQQPPC